MALGLICAPLPVVMLFVLWKLGRPLPRDPAILLLYACFFTAQGLHLILARVLGWINPIGCGAAGLVGFAGWPIAVVISRGALPNEYLAKIKTAALSGTIADEVAMLWKMPYAHLGVACIVIAGWLTGWLFWRIAIRPAPVPRPENKDTLDVFS